MEHQYEEEFREVFGVEGYEISRKGSIRNKKTKRAIKIRTKNNGRTLYCGLLKNKKTTTYRVFELIFKTYNPNNVEDVTLYERLGGVDIYYLDGEYSNLSEGNIGIKEESLYKIENNSDGVSILRTHNEKVNEFWDYTKNEKEGVFPVNYTYGSSKEAWWKCERGHTYRTSIRAQMSRIGCKECGKFNKVSIPQQILYLVLEENFEGVELENSVSNYRIDIYVRSVGLSIEYDGKAWHNTKEKIESDQYKEEIIIQENGGELIRVRENGCYPIESRGKVYTYDNNYNNEYYGKLLEIAYSIVGSYKKEVIKIDESKLDVLVNKIWYNENNSLGNTYPELEEYYSIDNKQGFRDLTYGSKFKVKWECKKCGIKWEQPVNQVTKRTPKKYCLECYYGKKEKRTKEMNKRKQGESTYIGGNRARRIPTKEELQEDLEETPNFTLVGGKYGVTDNAVRKWCTKFGLQRTTKHWLEYYKIRKGYMYGTYLAYETIKSEREHVINEVVRRYSEDTKQNIVYKDKLVTSRVYDLIGILHNLTRFEHEHNKMRKK